MFTPAVMNWTHSHERTEKQLVEALISSHDGEEKDEITAVLDRRFPRWNQPHSHPTSQRRASLLVEAIARLTGAGIGKAEYAVNSASKELIRTWRRHPKVKLAIAQIQAEKAKEKAKSCGPDDELDICLD